MTNTRLSLLVSCLTFYATALMGQPGSGIRLGKTSVLVPEASASYNWNDNVNLRRRALSDGGDILDESDSDTFINTGLSLGLRYWNASSQLNGKIWYNTKTYDTYSELDEPSYGANLIYFWATSDADTTIRTDVSYQVAVDRTTRNEDFIGDSLLTSELENVADRVERTEMRADVTLDQALITDMRGSVNYSIADISYEDPRYNDRVNQLISGEINYQWTDKTQPYLRGGIGIDEDEGLDGDAEKPFGLIGVRHEMTEKIDLDFAAGYEQYSRTPLEGDLAGVELTDDGIKWLARLNYRIFHKTLITASGRTGFNSVASSGSSSREETSASVAITHQTTPQIDQRASLAWRFDDYITPLPTKEGLLDEEKETLYYQYRIHYQTVRPWLTLYASLSYEDGSSKIPGDSYTETEITVGVKARY